jgi:hypothetical protein
MTVHPGILFCFIVAAAVLGWRALDVLLRIKRGY